METQTLPMPKKKEKVDLSRKYSLPEGVFKKKDPSGNNSGNSRNGSYPKTIQTVHGEHEISVPRDRKGTFEPLAVPRHSHMRSTSNT